MPESYVSSDPELLKRMGFFVLDCPEDGWGWGEEYRAAGGQFSLRMQQRFRIHEHLSSAEIESLIRFSIRNIQQARTKLDKEHERLVSPPRKCNFTVIINGPNGTEGTEMTLPGHGAAVCVHCRKRHMKDQ